MDKLPDIAEATAKRCRRILLAASMAMAITPVAATAAGNEAADTALVQTPSIQERIWNSRSLAAGYANEVYANPAAMEAKHGFSLTTVSAAGNYHTQNKHLFYEDGDGGNDFTFEAKSYLRRRTYVLWGEAAYVNERQHNVVWNEVSDRELLYPYLAADSAGGNLNKEIYSFKGGYAGSKQRLAWGGEIAYKASVAYRAVDPRPRNVTSDLNMRLGASYAIRKYRVGIYALARKYKQSNDIDFYSETGSAKVYHTTGLGMHYVRFAGNNYESYYNGHAFGAGVELHPANLAGWHAAAEYNVFTFEKILSSLNELPMAEATDRQLRASLAYKRPAAGKQSWGAGINAMHANRKGTENIFGDPASGIYPQIAAAQQYKRTATALQASGYYETGSYQGFSCAASLKATYRTATETYAGPWRKMHVSTAGAECGIYLAYARRNSTWRLDASAGYDAPLAHELVMTLTQGGDDTLVPVAEQAYQALTSSHAHFGAGINYAHRVKGNLAIELKVAWKRDTYGIGTISDKAAATLSFIF